MLAVLGAAQPARADLYGAFRDYKKGDYPQAFGEFLALAKLGQPLAQLTVARMYHAGRGTDWSDIHAYAWATLAAANGEAGAGALAEKIRPLLAPGSEGLAQWIAAPYTAAALERTLLPNLSSGARQPRHEPTDAGTDCERKVVRINLWKQYPAPALNAGVEGTVLVEFTLMPDGTARFPRIVFAVPTGFFEDVAEKILLRSRFSPAPAGTPPVQCSIPFRFRRTGRGDAGSIEDYERELGISTKLGSEAKAGDPQAQQLYGLLLEGEPVTEYQERPPRHPASAHPHFKFAGLPWLVKAAQAGMPAAQYEIAHDLLQGNGCRRNEVKALKWLRMAADQSQANADITLAARLLHGTPSAAEVSRAKAWLDRAASQGATDGRGDAQLLLAAVLAATPYPQLRDPRRALELVSTAHHVRDDPTPLEIEAAAHAAQGDFAAAVRNQRTAIARARGLGWDLTPLKQRLSDYASRKPWYGNLLQF